MPAATRLADPRARAIAHRGLSWAHVKLNRYEDATTHLLHALELSVQAGDPVGQDDVHLDLSRGLANQGRFAEAMDHARQALDLYKEADQRDGLALALNNLGMACVELGDHERGLACCRDPWPCTRSTCTATSVTATRSPRPWPTSATAGTPQAIRLGRVSRGEKRCRSSTTSPTPTPTGCAPSSALTLRQGERSGQPRRLKIQTCAELSNPVQRTLWICAPADTEPPRTSRQRPVRELLI